MLNLMKGVLEPSVSYQDKIMYLNSLGLAHSIGSDKNANNPVCVETILNLLTTPSTRYEGLQLLELALYQSPDNIYNRGKWVMFTYNIIKDSRSATLEKIQACKILSKIIPYMSSDSSFDSAKDELIKDIFPYLVEKIGENVEWIEEACLCVKMCLKTFPNLLAFHQGLILDTILQQASHNVSSKSFEVLAECFCELPYCCKSTSVENVQGRWNELYLRTLKTIESLQRSCLSYASHKGSYASLGIDEDEFTFQDEGNDSNFFQAFVKRVRRYVNLCKCLAKLLSVKSRYPVTVPVDTTMKSFLPLYTCICLPSENTEEGILFTLISQMQLAGFTVFESIMLNYYSQKNAGIIEQVFRSAIKSSEKTETVSEVRVAIWKLLSMWLDGLGRSVSKQIAESSIILDEILKDIKINSSGPFQLCTMQNTTKKNASSDPNSLSELKKENQRNVCEAALTTLESLLYAGTLDFKKGVFQDLCFRIFELCRIIHSSCDPIPFPYDGESCRKKLYSIVQTIVVVVAPDEYEILQIALDILSHISKDPSFEVRKLNNKVSVICRLQVCPKRPTPINSGNKERQPASNEIPNYSEWPSTEYIPNLNAVTSSKDDESANLKIGQACDRHSESEAPSEEYMDVEPHYSEQVAENQCNGDELLEIQTSSQCQDDVESEEEEEEEEEERSYGDEEINQEEPSQEMYIPSSSRVQDSPSSVQINSETVQTIAEQDYEELAPSIKGEASTLNSRDKDQCVNGESNAVHDENMPSSSKLTNENGVFAIDDDDADEENEDEDEESELYPEEKKAENYDPPPKRQKIEPTDDSEVDDRKERGRSPTMEEMKADFLELLPSIEDVKSGKVQLSTS